MAWSETRTTLRSVVLEGRRHLHDEGYVLGLREAPRLESPHVKAYESTDNPRN